MNYVMAALMLVTAALPMTQRLELDALDALAERAESTTLIDLASDMLEFANPFLSEGSDEGLARELIANLDGIYVRVLEDLTYQRSELGAVRDQLVAAQWTRLVSIEEDDEEVGVWVYRGDGAVTGMFILVAEEDEIVAVNIVGRIDAEDLAVLGRQFGVPILDIVP